jgi:hypothetical protein
MRKSFRVATVFAGAAACAAAFAPAAGAAPATPKAITPNDCTAGEYDWAHMWYTVAERHPTPACYGGTGGYRIPGSKRFVQFCPGGNSGFLGTSRGIVPFSAGAYSIPLYSGIVYSVNIGRHSDPSAHCRP